MRFKKIIIVILFFDLMLLGACTSEVKLPPEKRMYQEIIEVQKSKDKLFSLCRE